MGPVTSRMIEEHRGFRVDDQSADTRVVDQEKDDKETLVGDSPLFLFTNKPKEQESDSGRELTDRKNNNEPLNSAGGLATRRRGSTPLIEKITILEAENQADCIFSNNHHHEQNLTTNLYCQDNQRIDYQLSVLSDTIPITNNGTGLLPNDGDVVVVGLSTREAIASIVNEITVR